MATIRSLRVMMYVDHTKVTQGLKVVERKVREGSNKINAALVKAVAGGGAAMAATFFRSLQIAARRQKLEVSAAVLGGTQSLWNDVNARAANSAIPTDEWLAGTNRLLGAGVAVEDLMGLMNSLADLSAGTGSSIQELGLVYSQVFAKGKLQGEEMLQFMERNINLMPALQKHLGKSADEIKKMQAEGKILASDVAKAMEIMTTGDGRFAGMDAAMVQTLSGAIQRLFNTINYGLQRVGTTLTPVVGLLANELGYWLGPNGPIVIGLDMIAAALSVIGLVLGTIAVWVRWIDSLTFGWASSLLAGIAVLVTMLGVIVGIEAAVAGIVAFMKTAAVASFLAMVEAFALQILGLFGMIAGWIMTITGLTMAWASVLTLGLVPLFLFIAWVIRGIYRGLTEGLRKEQQRTAELKRQKEEMEGRTQFAGATFGSESAFSIMAGAMQQQAIQNAQLEILKQIEENTSKIDRETEERQKAISESPGRLRLQGL